MAKKERQSVASRSKRSIMASNLFNGNSTRVVDPIRVVDQRQNELMAQGQAQVNVVDPNADNLIREVENKVSN